MIIWCPEASQPSPNVPISTGGGLWFAFSGSVASPVSILAESFERAVETVKRRMLMLF